MKRLLLLLLLAVHGQALAGAAETRIHPENVVVVVNRSDANSVAVGDYYLQARRIPPENRIEVDLRGNKETLSREQFLLLRHKIYSALQDHHKVILMAWSRPYAVDCNAITSALTLGFDAEQCKNGCAGGRQNPYFDSPLPPASDLRLSMLLPTEDVALAKAVIDRGVLSGFRLQPSGAYFLTTSDRARSSRSAFFPPEATLSLHQLQIHRLEANFIENRQDVMIYHTGQANVPKLETLGFRPGAIADHLTSYGGKLSGNGQMSVLKWLEAGATASYGTVSEPCNHWQKFPNSSVLLKHYLNGDTLIEAYWKSVAWPAQGLFVGEPLAAPYCFACYLAP